MRLWSDEKKHGARARAAAALEGEGGPAREVRRRGTVYDAHTSKTTSLGNLVDAVRTFRAGR